MTREPGIAAQTSIVTPWSQVRSSTAAVPLPDVRPPPRHEDPTKPGLRGVGQHSSRVSGSGQTRNNLGTVADSKAAEMQNNQMHGRDPGCILLEPRRTFVEKLVRFTQSLGLD